MDTKQLRDLMEAYSEVYAPEQLDEAYLSEIPTSTQMGGKPAQAARPQPRVMTAFDAGGGNARVRELMRQGIGGVEANRRVSTTGEYLQRQAATKADASRNRFPTGLAGRPAGSNPPARPAGSNPPARPAGSNPPARPAGSNPPARPAGSTPPARPAGSNPPARPAGSNPPARPAAAPTGGVAKPTPAPSTPAEKPSAMDQWAKANPRLAQAQQIRKQGGSRAEVNKALYNKGTAAATSTPTVVKAGFDLFDVVKGYLIDEGFAETEQAAIAIMANMSEDWKTTIIGEASSRDEFTRAAIARNSGRKGGITFEPGPNWDPSANRGRGAHLNPKQKEKQRRKALRQEEYMDEAQEARNNPEKYEREQSKKSAPVRGERTPMPPRGDKRREDFEKWYAKQMGR